MVLEIWNFSLLVYEIVVFRYVVCTKDDNYEETS